VSGMVSLPALRWEASTVSRVDEQVAVEQPVALRYNAAPFAVMLATPADLEDFALGFSLSEGIIGEPAELQDVACDSGEAGITIDMAIPQARFDALDARRRSIGAYSGCGLCGTETLQAAMRPAPRVTDTLRADPRRIYDALNALTGRQPLNAHTGGVHAAAWVGDGEMLVREDVGRHNALDKLVGALARRPPSVGFLLMTSRASYEIVHKAACAGIEMVVAISAPTALAIRTAEDAGITLCAFLRGEAMNVYCGAVRLRDPQ
jgi:FdhD protein